VLTSYSGSDIAILVRDALMQPVRKVLNATHFKQVQTPDGFEDNGTTYLTPCSPGDQGAVEMTWADVDSKQLVEPRLVMSDFLKAVHSVRPSVSGADSMSDTDKSKSTPNLLMNLG
jgi:vacuolar protein-sorting-associated protein 4